MSGWNNLSGPVQDDILFQVPVEYIISFCQIGIFNCEEGIREFNEDNYFWKQYFRINPYNYLKYKLEKNGKIDNIEDEILIEASKLGSIVGVKQALNKGANIHAQYNKALLEAAQNDNSEMVELLLERGEYDEALREAAKNGNAALVDDFLILDPRAVNDRALREAAQSGHLDVLRFLHENGADIRASDNDFAVRLAAQASGSGHLDVLRFLRNQNIVGDQFNGHQLIGRGGQSTPYQNINDYDPFGYGMINHLERHDSDSDSF